MTLPDIEAVRLKVADRPTLRREEWEADGVLSEVQLKYHPIVALPVLRVWKNNTLQVVDVDYTVDLPSGVVVILPSVPAIESLFVFEFTSVAFSDAEVQHFLDETSSTTLAAANLLLAWSADAARIAQKESLAGGGGYGSMSITTDMRARELRETAKAYFAQYQQYEAQGVAAEYITEVAWTDHMAERMILNDILDRTV